MTPRGAVAILYNVRRFLAGIGCFGVVGLLHDTLRLCAAGVVEVLDDDVVLLTGRQRDLAAALAAGAVVPVVDHQELVDEHPHAVVGGRVEGVLLALVGEDRAGKPGAPPVGLDARGRSPQSKVRLES